ncbi:MAG: universal stress protein [Deltaproteobacteria bacterium]|nr:universal stress protein [Deltaproteobacteria bacterium]
MGRFSKVLIAVDFSEFTADVVEIGCRFAREYGAEVEIIHVVEEGFLLLDLDGMSLPAADLESIRAAVESHKKVSSEKIAMLVDLAEKVAGKPVKGEVVEGYPSRTVVDEAASRGADVIFVGSHGWSGIKRFLMGSVATSIVKHAKCSVMVVRQGQKENK